MMKDFFWNIFTHSGNIEIYLAYCELKNFRADDNCSKLNDNIKKFVSCY